MRLCSFFFQTCKKHMKQRRERGGKKVFYFSLISFLTQWAAGREVWSRDMGWCRNCSFLDVSMQNWNVCRYPVKSWCTEMLQRAPASTPGFPLPSSLRGFSIRRVPRVQMSCSQGLEGSHGWQAQALSIYVNVSTEHLWHAGLFASMALALASLHKHQKVVENIYANRLWAAVLMEHLWTRQNLNCPKMGHMCSINTLLWRSGE